MLKIGSCLPILYSENNGAVAQLGEHIDFKINVVEVQTLSAPPNIQGRINANDSAFFYYVKRLSHSIRQENKKKIAPRNDPSGLFIRSRAVEEVKEVRE